MELYWQKHKSEAHRWNVLKTVIKYFTLNFTELKIAKL